MKSDETPVLESILRRLSVTLRTLADDADLAARILAGQRDGARDAPGTYARVAKLVDDGRFLVRWNGRECGLGQTLLFRLFRRLATSCNRYVSHQDLLDDVWGAERSSVAIRTVVRDLRRRLVAAGMKDLAGAIDGKSAGYYALRLDRVGQPDRPHRNPTEAPP
jgi:DNA-binding response OmpR family regulator